MRTIYKYPLQITDQQTLDMPFAYTPELLTVQFQNGQLCLWAEVDTEENNHPINIFIVGTGYPIPDFKYSKFIGTAQDPEIGAVWHVYEGY